MMATPGIVIRMGLYEPQRTLIAIAASNAQLRRGQLTWEVEPGLVAICGTAGELCNFILELEKLRDSLSQGTAKYIERMPEIIHE
jgi:hypothetical protein